MAMREGRARGLRPRAGSKSLGGRLVAGLVLAAAVAGVGVVRPRLAEQLKGVKDSAEIYVLPPPETLPVASLGYHSALADILFTKALIAHAIHSETKRRFDAIADYLDAIVALDPTLRDVYRFADTLIVYHAVGEPTPELIRRAWRILETGLEMRPGDAQIWLSTGQFMAFIAPQWLPDPEEQAAFRALGARQLARASELAGEDETAVSWHAMAAAGVFTKAGEREAAISYLERAYMVSDSDVMREQIAQRLSRLKQDAELERAKLVTGAFTRSWKADLPFVSRTQLLVLGPRWEIAKCTGKPSSEAGCARSWAGWAQALRD